uniref:ELKS/RAB6-interacting/CAST family member 2 n=1 Tax=Neolamprologus brichardi TaxID=32507 RepID=A0A3Q4N3L7_NEOBR
MPLNIRAKPTQSKLSAAAKGSGHTDGSSSHSRFSRSPKHGKGKQAVSSAPGARSGLEPGSVSGGVPATPSKLTGGQGSVSRPGSKIKAEPEAGKGSTRGSATAPGGKTLSMENIQSLSAAYATSGTMYPSERESLEPSAGYPKGTMTLGRSTSRSSYTGRTTATGSSPNITSSGMHHLDLQRENNNLRRELEGGRDGRTGPSMNSVNFWSPDVKREKGVRREEAARSSTVKDQYRTNQEDLQQLPLTVQELQEELRAHREMNSRSQQHQENFFQLQSEHERQAKELSLLRKTMEEMEMRIDSQKQTLGARDESIQRLLEMLQGQSQGQSQGQGQGHWGRGQRTGIITMAAQEAEAQLENVHLREELHRRNQLQADPAKTRALQTVIDMKDTKISSLERNIRDLEDEVQMLKTSGLLHSDERQDELKQVEVYKSHSKFMKTKVEYLSSVKVIDVFLINLRLYLQYWTPQCASESANVQVDALRVRLEEKEQFLTKKTKQLQDLTDEKSTLTGEIRDMKDMLDVKERKINVLQKKIENLLEQLKDKDKQVAGLRERVQGLQTDSSNTDTALATLEEALSEKERVIENLREQKDREDRVRLEELEQLRKENHELKDKLSVMQPQKQPQNQLGNPSPSGLSCLNKLNNLHKHSRQRGKDQQKKAETQRKIILEEAVKMCPDITDRLRVLEQEVGRYREESRKSQAEVERLMGALNDAEMDKSCKEKKISDLERNTARSEGKHTQTNSHNLLPLLASQDALRDTAERIMELERALRESMNTSAHREALWAQEEAARVQAQRQLEELMGALEKTRQELDATKLRLSSTQQSLHERDGHLNSLRQERRKQLEEILEMKQQALLAAISEKDANIALLELSSSKRKKAQEEVMALKREKDRLMHQLKQQTQSRMKMIADNYEEDYIHPQHHPHHSHHMHPANVHHRSLPRAPLHANHRPPVEQVGTNTHAAQSCLHRLTQALAFIILKAI